MYITSEEISEASVKHTCISYSFCVVVKNKENKDNYRLGTSKYQLQQDMLGADLVITFLFLPLFAYSICCSGANIALVTRFRFKDEGSDDVENHA